MKITELYINSVILQNLNKGVLLGQIAKGQQLAGAIISLSEPQLFYKYLVIRVGIDAAGANPTSGGDCNTFLIPSGNTIFLGGWHIFNTLNGQLRLSIDDNQVRIASNAGHIPTENLGIAIYGIEKI